LKFIERYGYRLEQLEPAQAVDAMLRLASPSQLAEANFGDWLLATHKAGLTAASHGP
jgi:hypothetical protein